MNRQGILLLLLAVTFRFDLRSQEKDHPPNISRLVEQLGDPRYARREQADQALREIGEPALAALRKAASGRDAEARRRAARLVRQIEQRTESVRLRTSPRVRFVCKDTPILEAVADISRTTGMPIKIEGDRTRLEERKVTLDTGETTFWEAMARFCAKAGLIEVDPSLPAPPPMRGFSTSSVIVIRGGGFRPEARDILRPDESGPAYVFTLADGKPVPLPTHDGGAVRVRALPPNTEVKGMERSTNEILFALEGKAGPHLIWKRAAGLRIDHALDDQGQRLRPIPTPFEPEKSADSGQGSTRVFINQIPVGPPKAPEPPQPQVPVRLAVGEKPSKMLRELRGTILAQVQTPPETLIVVDNVLRSAGRTVKGSRGGFVKLVDAVRQEDGQVRLRVQVEAPPGQIDDGTILPDSALIIIDGQRVGPREEPLSAANFALLDDKGRRFRAVKVIDTGIRAGTARELELTYQPIADQTQPARFVFTGRRVAMIEVPFTLRDVPLP